LVDIQEVDNL